MLGGRPAGNSAAGDDTVSTDVEDSLILHPLLGSLFSGVAGLDRAVEAVTGATPAWFVEFDAAPSKVLARHYPDIPNYGDVTTVDWSQVEPIDILTGGFPCQDLSHAGNRKGLRQLALRILLGDA